MLIKCHKRYGKILISNNAFDRNIGETLLRSAAGAGAGHPFSSFFLLLRICLTHAAEEEEEKKSVRTATAKPLYFAHKKRGGGERERRRNHPQKNISTFFLPLLLPFAPFLRLSPLSNAERKGGWGRGGKGRSLPFLLFFLPLPPSRTNGRRWGECDNPKKGKPGTGFDTPQ